MTGYLFDQAWQSEKRRLDALSALYDAGSVERLARVGIAKDWTCLEVGAGSGTVAAWLAGRASRVVATDRDARFLVADQGYEVREHDLVTDSLEPAAFDLVHARAVLQHIPERESVVGKLVAALRPGGWLVLEDIVEPHSVCDPPLPVWGTFLAAMTAGLARTGADPSYGIRLGHALERSRLANIGIDARVEVMHTGTPSIDFVALSLEHVAPRMTAAGAMTPAQIDELRTAFATPGRTMTAAIMISAWGQKVS